MFLSNLKDLNWRTFKHEEEESDVVEYFAIVEFNHEEVIEFIINNVKSYVGEESIVDDKAFYLYYVEKQTNSRRKKFANLESAKQKAQSIFSDMVKESFFKPIPARKVLLEKRRKRKETI